MEKEIPFSLPDLGLAQPLPRGLPISLPPPVFHATAQPAPAQPISRPRGTTAPRASPLLVSAADRAAPLSASPPGGTHLSGSSSTLCPSRTRAAPQPRACFARSSPDSAQLLPFKYRPEAPLAPQSIPSRSHRAEFAKAAAEIRRILNPPSQRFRASASNVLRFVYVVRSRRDFPFALYYFVPLANPRRTFFQGHRPPFSVAGVLRPPRDPVLALGEFAVSSTTPRCFRFFFSCPKARTPRTSANSGHGAAAPAQLRLPVLPSPTLF